MNLRYQIKNSNNYMQSSLPTHLLLSVIVLLLVGCQHNLNDKPREVPDSLIVLSGAKDIRPSSRYGTSQVSYQLHKCYPGQEIIDELSVGMLQKKWILLNEDFLNPGLRSNHARGEWSTFWDANGNYVYQWIEDWKDSEGNIIRYGLRYMAKNKENPLNNCDMTVYGIYHPKKVLDDLTTRDQKTQK